VFCFNADRSYTIDISGHGLKALRHIDARSLLDERLIHFRGLKVPGGRTEEWRDQGWTGSRGDITRALMARVEEQLAGSVSFEFTCHAEAVDVRAGEVAYTHASGDKATRTFNLVGNEKGNRGQAVQTFRVELGSNAIEFDHRAVFGQRLRLHGEPGDLLLERQPHVGTRSIGAD
jgi:hypothetical protein